MKKLGLYIHIPFCLSKCKYCDFNSYVDMGKYTYKYLEALKKEIVLNSKKIEGYIVDTIFIGGGTPTLLENKFYLNLIFFIKNYFKIDKDVEFTIESNPGTLNIDKTDFYYNMGINRLSLGLQAWQNEILQYIGRIHTIEDFKKSFKCVEESGFKNINVDLMFGIPNQDLNQWKETLDNILNLDIKHISAYSLKIEEKTFFGKLYNENRIEYLDDEIEREMYYICNMKLKDFGFEKYEISNYSIKGFECKHNLKYWKCNEYIGIGAGAHSYLDNKRYSNVVSLTDYIDYCDKRKDIIIESNYIDKNEKIKEFIILGLRCKEGINIEIFKRFFGQSIFYLFSGKILLLKEKGLISIKDGFIRLTEKGFDFANEVFIEFI